MTHPEKLVLYDGECGFCQRSVQVLIRLDRRKRLLFAPLQGSMAKVRLEALDRLEVLGEDSLVLVDGAKVHLRSGAVMRCLIACGGLWHLLRIFLIVPWFLRDPIYRLFASRRKSFFRKRACPVPTAAERERMLD